MRPLEKYQRTRLETMKSELSRNGDIIWGLLPPSSERDNIRFSLHNAIHAITVMLEEPEQMTMDDLIDEGK